jgi:uncharacterized peroxidase-related enzyme
VVARLRIQSAADCIRLLDLRDDRGKDFTTMAHIRLPEGIPGILGPMAFSPETAKPLNELAEVLLHAPNSLSRADREMIATYVSSQNDCNFCQSAHGAVAAHHLDGNEELVNQVKQNFAASPISEKLKALLAIAGQVQKGGKHVSAEAVENARRSDATDKEIHDTVLIAAAFCMFNRYVDGLGTWAPQDPAMYRANGKRLAEEGYVHSTDHLPRAANG